MENFDPNAKAGAEFKSPQSEIDDDKSDKKSDKKSSAKDIALPKLFEESKVEDTPAEKTSILSGLISREEEPADNEMAEADDFSGEDIADIETLSDGEARYAAEAIINDRQEDVNAELAEVDHGSSEEMEAAANSALLDAMQDHLDAGDHPEAAIDAAVQETMAEIAEMAEDNSQENPELPAETNEAEPTEDSTDDEEDDPNSVTPPVVTPTPAPAVPIAPIVAAPPQGPPQQPPGPPGGPGVNPNAGPSQPGGPGNPNNPNALPQSPNVMPIPVPVETRRGNRAGDMLLGGVVGYLIGRRRGRHKAEKELLPIQHKLEKEVKSLQEKIADKESEVRTAAREQLAPKVVAREQEPASTIDKTPATPAETLIAEHQAHQAERPASPPSLEATQPEYQSRPLETLDAQKVDWKIAAFNEVLAMAATIEVQDNQSHRRNIKEMFERGSISREEVRRLVVEYARGASREAMRPRMETVETNETLREQTETPHTESADAKQAGASGNVQSPVAAQSPGLQPQLMQSTQPADQQHDTPPQAIFSSLEQKSKQHDNQLKAVVGGSVAVGLLIAFSLLLWLK